MSLRPDDDNTARIAGLFAERIATAKASLAAAMDARGLTAGAGWRIHEDIVASAEGPVMRLRPLHRAEPAPEGLEMLVSLR